jgi:hypothetical protein
MINKSRDHFEGRHMQNLTPKTKYVLWMQLAKEKRLLVSPNPAGSVLTCLVN